MKAFFYSNKLVTLLSLIAAASLMSSTAFGAGGSPANVKVVNQPEVRVTGTADVRVTNRRIEVSNHSDELVLVGILSDRDKISGFGAEAKRNIEQIELLCPRSIARVIGNGIKLKNIRGIGPEAVENGTPTLNSVTTEAGVQYYLQPSAGCIARVVPVGGQ